MQLPPALRQAVDAALDGVPREALAAAQDNLSRRYRGEVRDGRAHIVDDLAARAYLAARLPATYAALRAALGAVATLRPEFAPRSLLDFGAGPGTALWAVRDGWSSLDSALLIEASSAVRAFGSSSTTRMRPRAAAGRVLGFPAGSGGGLLVMLSFRALFAFGVIVAQSLRSFCARRCVSGALTCLEHGVCQQPPPPRWTGRWAATAGTRFGRAGSRR